MKRSKSEVGTGIAIEEEEEAGCETFKASARVLSARIEIRIY